MKYDKKSVLEFSKWLHENGITVYGERIAVLRDKEATMYGTGLLHKPDSHTRPASKGTVLMLGLGINEASSECRVPGLEVGERVVFNIYNTLQLSMPTEDGETVAVDFFHAADIYVGYPADNLNISIPDIEKQV